MERPTNTPEWATGVNAIIDTPSANRISNGWRPGDIPPAGQENYLINLLAQWAQWAESRIDPYDTLQDAADELDPTIHEEAIVRDSGNVAKLPGDVRQQEQLATTGRLICATGRYVIYTTAINQNPRVYNRDDLSTSVRTLTRNAAAGNNYYIVSDGRVAVVGSVNSTECFLLSDGSSVWRQAATTFGAVIIGSVMYNLFGLQVQKRSLSTGAVTVTYTHSGAGLSLQGICSDGRRVYVAGGASSYASGATHRALDMDLKDATNEGGTGTAAPDQAWNQTYDPPNATTNFYLGCMTCDEQGNLFVGYDTAATNQINKLDPATGEILASRQMLNGVAMKVDSLCCDQDHLYALPQSSQGQVIALDKRTLSIVWWRKWTSTKVGFQVATDGQQLYVAGEDNGALTYGIQSYVATTRTVRYRAIDPLTEPGRHYGLGILPLE